MKIKLGCACYAMDIERGNTFYFRGSVYIMISHGEDSCIVREIATRGENDMLTFVIRENSNFNSYGDVKPFSIEVQP